MATTTKKPATKKTAVKKPVAKKPAAKKTIAKKTTTKKSAAKKTTDTSLKLTATEKKLVELYRDASASTKKEAMEVLKADKKPNDSLIEAVLNNKDLKKVLTNLITKK